MLMILCGIAFEGTVAHPTQSNIASIELPSEAPGSLRANRLRSILPLLGLIALLALLVNLLYFIRFHDYYATDSVTYITPASNLINGRGFTGIDGGPETLRTPGYPLLIAVFLKAGLNLKYLVLLQHLMAAALALLTAAAAFKLSSSRMQAAIAGILVAIDFPVLEASNQILAEIFFTVTFLSAMWLLWTGSTQSEQRWSNRIFFSGLLAGAAALIRPVGEFFLVPVALYLLLMKRRFRLATLAMFVIPFLFLPVLWGVRNYREAGYAGLSSVTGYQVLYHAAGILALGDPGNFNSNMGDRRAQMEAAACNELKASLDKDCRDVSITRRSEYFGKVGAKLILQHPFGYLRLALRGAAVLMLDGGPTTLQGITGINQHAGVKLLLIYTVPALCFAIVGLWQLWKKDRQLWLLLFLTIVYFVVMSSGGESYSRYRVPIIPLCAILTAVGIATTREFFKRAKRKLL